MMLECRDCNATFAESLVDGYLLEEVYEFWGCPTKRLTLVHVCPLCRSEEVFEKEQETSDIEVAE